MTTPGDQIFRVSVDRSDPEAVDLLIQAHHDLVEETLTLRRQLERIDDVLARRPALGALPERWQKIEHCINTAKRYDDCAEEVLTLRERVRASAGGMDKLAAERDNWIESARQYAANSDYYRGLVQAVGALLGPEAYVADDGSVSEDVLCAKVPEVLSLTLDALRADRRRYRLVRSHLMVDEVGDDAAAVWAVVARDAEQFGIRFDLGRFIANGGATVDTALDAAMPEVP